MSEDLLKKYDLRRYEYRINWEITGLCNFNCSYCINGTNHGSQTPQIFSAKEINNFFKNTKKNWLILITGGEPFIYPDFVNICKELTYNNSLQITTNLSSPLIYEFADKISPEKIFILSASYHYLERKKRELTEDFKSKCLYLKSKGFPVLVNYIAHPHTMNRIEEDLAMFNDLGIETFVLLLRGYVDGKPYPEAYTKKELEIIMKYVLDPDTETAAAAGKLDFYSHYCNAGKNYFFVDMNGNISRCSTIRDNCGNLFRSEYRFNTKPTPCTVRNCYDVYCGITAVTDRKAGSLKMYFSNKQK